MLSRGIWPVWLRCTGGFSVLLLFWRLDGNVCVLWRVKARRGSVFEDVPDV